MLNKALKIIGVVFTVIIVSIVVLAYYYGEAYFKEKVNTFLAEKTDSIYQLEYDKIEIDFFDGDIKIYNFDLQFDTIKANKVLEKDPNTIFFNIRVKEFDALNFKYRKIFKEEVFEVEELRLNSPKISTYGTIKQSENITPDFSKNHRLNSLFKEIKINKISLENATYDIYSKLVKNTKFSKANRIDILVDQFYSNPELIQNKHYFDIKDLAIRFLGFENILGDSIHSLKADTLDFSLKKSYLNISNLDITPKYPQKNKDYFSLKTPKLHLQLEKLDLHAFDSILVQSLTIEKPQIAFYKNSVVKPSNSYQNINELNLYDLIKKDFKKVALSHLEIEEATFRYFSALEENRLVQQVERLDIELNDFSIDSISEKDPDKIFYADDFKIKVHDFELNLDDRIHRLEVDAFQLSSFNQNIALKNISIKPIVMNRKLPESFFLHADEVAINHIDLKKLYHQNYLEIEELWVDRIQVKNDLNEKIEKREQNESKLQKVLAPIFNKVKARKVHLRNASIDFNDYRYGNKHGHFKGEINFDLHDLEVDLLRFKENRRVLFSKKFNIAIEDYEFKSPKDVNIYQADRIKLENSTNQIHIDNLKIAPEIESHEALQLYEIASLLNISANHIMIKGIDFQKAVFDREFKATSFEIDQPIVDIETHKEFKKKNKVKKKFDPKEIEGIFYTALNYMPQIEVDHIIVPNGEIHLKTVGKEHGIKTNIHNEFNIEMDHFLFNENELKKTGKEVRLFFSDDAVFSVENQMFNLGDGVHKVIADHLSFHSKDRSLYIHGAQMIPDTKASNYHTIKGIYNVAIPKLEIFDIDLIKAFETDTISIGKVLLDKAKINLVNRPKTGVEVKKFNFKDFYLPLPENVKALKLRELDVNNTIVEIYKEDTIQKKPILKAELEITSNWKNFALFKKGVGKQTNYKIGEAVNYMKKIHLPFNNKADLKIENLKFDRTHGQFALNNILFQRGDQVEVKIDELAIEGLNSEKLYDDDFEAKEVIIKRPKIKIQDDPNTNRKGNQENPMRLDSINLYASIESIFNYIKTDRIKIQDADLQIGKWKQNRIDLEFEDVLINKQYDPNRLLHAKNIVLNVHDFHKSSKWYDFTVNHLQFMTHPTQLWVKDIKVTPTFSKESYREVMKEQVDRIEAEVEYVKLNQLDLSKWIKHEQIFAKNMEIGPTKIGFFKDTRVPKKAKVKPLPQTLIGKIKEEFYIEKIELKPSFLHYSEYSGYSPEGGNVHLDSLQFSINNVTNISEMLAQNPKVKGNATALFMGEGDLTVDLEFDLLAENESQRLKGSLTHFPLEELNDIAEEAAKVRIRDGQTQKIEFDMQLTNEKATGSVNLVYDNLNIALLRKKKLKEQKVLSGLINLILSDDSTNKQEQKDNIIYLKHDDQKSFVGYWWRSILSGVKYSFGLSSKEQREIKKDEK